MSISSKTTAGQGKMYYVYKIPEFLSFNNAATAKGK